MGGQKQLLCAAVLALFFQGISISGNAASGNEFITIEQKGKNVSLICEGGNNETRWIKDKMDLTYQGKELALAVMDDPRGIYECINNGKSRSLQVFIRMCQNCIRLDFTMILGTLAASLLSTLFLAIAVYHIAVEERGQPTQASDKQCLLANDQLYQKSWHTTGRESSHARGSKLCGAAEWSLRTAGEGAMWESGRAVSYLTRPNFPRATARPHPLLALSPQGGRSVLCPYRF